MTSTDKRKGSGGIVLGLAVVGLLVGGGMLAYGLLSRAKQAMIAAATAVDVPSAARGAVPNQPLRLSGKIVADPPAKLPGKGEDVVWGTVEIRADTWDYDTKKRERRRKSRSLLKRDARASSVFIEADGARLAVDPDAFGRATIESAGPSTEIGHPNGDYVVHGDLRVRLPDEELDGLPRVYKDVLRPYDAVFVVGAVSELSGKPALVATGDGTLIISAKSEAEVLAALARSAAWAIPTGGGLLGLGLVGVIAGAVMLARGGKA